MIELDKNLLNRLKAYIPGGSLSDTLDAQTITGLIRQLNGLHIALASFLPLYIAENNALLVEDTGTLRTGTFLFADVSGFTALSEKLQREGGGDGPEVLTLVINDYFATMLEILAKSDGQLLKFAGDALLAFFPSGTTDDALKAVRTGLRMQRAMSKFQPIQTPELVELLGDHDQQLTMSIGISRGDLFEALIGNLEQRDLVIQGGLPGKAMEAEEAGEKNDVIIDAELQAIYADDFTTEFVVDGFYQVIDDLGNRLDDYEFSRVRRRRTSSYALFDYSEQDLLQELERELVGVENVGRFLAPEIRQQIIESGNNRLQSQNRLVVTMFVHVSGFADLLMRLGNDHLDLVTQIVDRYYSLMQQEISRRGGVVTRSDPYKQGTKLLITFGAPISHLDDADRAVGAALEMKHQVELLNARLQGELADFELGEGPYITQRCGITFGSVFAGEVGWKQRREYTVMGDDVNLAARFMANAEMGQILISARVKKRIGRHYEITEIEPLTLKGKSEPVPAFIVERSDEQNVELTTTSLTPFVGREDLLEMFGSMLDQTVEQKQRRAIALLGDAGCGKTRLAKEVSNLATDRGFRVAWVQVSLQGELTSVRKETWSRLIVQLIGLTPDMDGTTQREHIHQVLDQLDLDALAGSFVDLMSNIMHLDDSTITKTQQIPMSPRRTKSPTKDLTDIFQRVQTSSKEELKRSGVFGIASRRDTAEMQAADTTESSTLYNTLAARTSLDESISQFLVGYTQQQPVLLVIDDLHRENPQALGILNRLLSENRPMQLMILATMESFDDLESQIPAIPLPDLSQDETHALARAILHVDDLGERLAALLWQRTNGRPLFVESLLETLQSNNQVERSEEIADLTADADLDALPDDVRNLVISRIDRLDSELRNLLHSAAVLGETFLVDAVAALTKISVYDLPPLLDKLAREQIIEPAGAGRYRFRYTMTQRTLYEVLPRLQRQKLHRAAAEYWDQGDDTEHTIKVAYHFLSAGMPTRALGLVTERAERAEYDNKIDRAIELYTHALAVFPTEDSIRTDLSRLQEIVKDQP